MKKALLTFLLISFFGFFNAKAEDSFFDCIDWNLLLFSTPGGNTEEIPGSVGAKIFTTDDDAFFIVGDGDEDNILNLLVIEDLHYDGSQKIEGIDFDVFSGSMLSLPNEEEGTIYIFLGKDGVTDAISIALPNNSYTYFGERTSLYGLPILKELATHSSNHNRTTPLSVSLKKAFPDNDR